MIQYVWWYNNYKAFITIDLVNYKKKQMAFRTGWMRQYYISMKNWLNQNNDLLNESDDDNNYIQDVNVLVSLWFSWSGTGAKHDAIIN